MLCLEQWALLVTKHPASVIGEPQTLDLLSAPRQIRAAALPFIEPLIEEIQKAMNRIIESIDRVI